MRRFFLSCKPPDNGLLKITGPEVHHLKNVLRLKSGSRVIFFDGQGCEYEAELENLASHEISARIISHRQEAAERCRVCLAQGLLTGQKMDLVVQKATELGISAILPFTSRYSAVREASTNKIQRWQRIAREACKQCQRTREPEILPVTGWTESLELASQYDLTVVFWEKEATNTLEHLRTLITKQPPTSLLFLIGPEGGLTSEEIAQAREKHAQIIGLGKRILRAETASLTAAALVQYLVGNLD
ncbi:MAG: 16S rRNA (uracil(1498)-N(3))-methyltransferase [Desulfobulbaceae bacterium]|nr:16S rRNA (uracil(1498)-N(3))-methyltransferase [Desulfobulbaceae bacterium]